MSRAAIRAAACAGPVLALVPALILAACAPVDSPRRGAALYAAHCAACHGPSARGGPAGLGLDPPPPDLTAIAARRGGIWPRFEVMAIIDGYSKRSAPRPGMPVIGNFLEGPLVTVPAGNGQNMRAPADLVAITAYLETLQAPPPLRHVP